MSLVWKSQRPTVPGWYWKSFGGRESIVHVFAAADSARTLKCNLDGGTLYGDPLRELKPEVQWAGPIARPKAPSKESLALVR